MNSQKGSSRNVSVVEPDDAQDGVALLDEMTQSGEIDASPALNAEDEVSRPRTTAKEREVAELRELVANKDELISALVAELEQVVEQVDRMQRAGLEKPRHGATSSSGECSSDQQQVFSELNRVVSQWDELQAAEVLSRIEAEVLGIRSLLTGGSLSLVASPSMANPNASPTDSIDDVISRLSIGRAVTTSTSVTSAESSHASEKTSSPDVHGGASWESMKRQMLGEPDPEPARIEEVEQVEETVLREDGTIPGLNADFHLESVSYPTPIAFETATIDVLKKACSERDNYIAQLTRLIRARCSVTLPRNWDDIEGVSDAQRDRAEKLIERLEEQVRLAEVEMSLERARLSRERSQIQAEREFIEKQLKRLGLHSIEDLETLGTDHASSSDRRWMRFLGSKNK